MRSLLTLGLVFLLPVAAFAQDGALQAKRAEFQANRSNRVEQAKSLRTENQAERKGLIEDAKVARQQHIETRQQKRQEQINKAQGRLDARKAR